nr:hypothetical protein [Kibdelosporangium sp. MJ126-NF4]CTQ90527.1 hypothetical protein [Kibdelosporangium sp. MJ126-NF4]
MDPDRDNTIDCLEVISEQYLAAALAPLSNDYPPRRAIRAPSRTTR